MNLRPPGYEPDELPTALPRVINIILYAIFSKLCSIILGDIPPKIRLVPETGVEPVRSVRIAGF